MAISDVNGDSGSYAMSGFTGVVTLTTTPALLNGNANIVYNVTLMFYKGSSPFDVLETVKFIVGPNTPIRIYDNTSSTYGLVIWHYAGMVIS